MPNDEFLMITIPKDEYDILLLDQQTLGLLQAAIYKSVTYNDPTKSYMLNGFEMLNAIKYIDPSLYEVFKKIKNNNLKEEE